MQVAEAIRTVADLVRRNPPADQLNRCIQRVLQDVAPHRRADLRVQIDNAVAAVRREVEAMKSMDVSSLMKRPAPEVRRLS